MRTLAALVSVAGLAAISATAALAEPSVPYARPTLLRCGGTDITVGMQGDVMVLAIGDERYALQSVDTTSGVRFVAADDPRTTFWSHDGRAMLVLAGRVLPVCARPAIAPSVTRPIARPVQTAAIAPPPEPDLRPLPPLARPAKPAPPPRRATPVSSPAPAAAVSAPVVVASTPRPAFTPRAHTPGLLNAGGEAWSLRIADGAIAFTGADGAVFNAPTPAAHQSAGVTAYAVSSEGRLLHVALYERACADGSGALVLVRLEGQTFAGCER